MSAAEAMAVHHASLIGMIFWLRIPLRSRDLRIVNTQV
jgi:hypothetical protein